MTLGIIGTAGRGPDAALLNAGYWRSMLTVAQVTAETLGATTLVSGGAPWSDHLAVALWLNEQTEHLSLHLAAEWTPFGFKEGTSAAATANEGHAAFSEVVGFNSLAQIQDAVEQGARVHVNHGGFKARNTDIANEADALLAFTFGDGAVLKPGGTRDTWGKWMERRVALDATDTLHGMRAFHFNLTDRRLYRV